MKKISTALFVMLLSFCVSAQDGQGRAWSYTYHPNGLVASIDGPRTDVADVTSFSYDSAGRLIQITNALGHITQLSSFDSHGNPQVVIDANGVTTTLGYTPQGWLQSSTTAGSTTSYQYDSLGQITRITLGDGSWLHYTWDAARRLTAIENPLGERIEYTLDAQGNRIGETLKSGASIRYQQQRIYDELGRLLKHIGANGHSQHYSYDLGDNLISNTNALGHTTNHSYDALNRLASTQDALGGIASINHDTQNRPTQINDPRDVATTYEYDALGNLTARQSPDSGTTSYSRDAAGNIIQSTDARGIITHYTWDALNRITSRTFPSAPQQNISYSYDSTTNGNHGIGRLTSIQDASGITQYTWDAHGNLTQRSHNDTSVQWTYDAANRITQTTYPGGSHIHHSRNAGGRITAIHWQANGAAAPQPIATNITYEPWGSVKNLTWGNGLTLTRNYNQDARLTQQSIATLDSSSHTLDAGGNITQITSSTWGNLNYQYDALDRLLQSLHENNATEYSYDAAGNRIQKNHNTTTTHYNYAPTSNRLTDIDGQTLSSNATGSITQDTNNRSFTYDAQGRLQSVHINGTQVASYTYNALGQRSHKHTADGTTTYQYDQNGQLLSWTQHDINGTVQHSQHYIWLEEMPVAVLNISNDNTEILYLHPDHLETPRLATNAQQTIVWKLPPHQPFGEDQEQTDPDGDGQHTHIALRFAGQIYDQETGLHYNWFRNYDPSTGRYIESDPIGLEGGLNTYAYVGNNPLGYVDPTGEYAIPFPPLVVVVGVGCALSPGCRDAVKDILTKGNSSGEVDDVLENPFVYSKGGRQNKRESGLVGTSDEEVEQQLKDAKSKGDTQEVERLVREQKVRGKRNEQKRKNEKGKGKGKVKQSKECK